MYNDRLIGYLLRGAGPCAASVTLGYQLTCRLRATFGYTFLYRSRAARPGDHIDLDVNPLQIPPAQQGGAPRPEFPWVTDDFWAQGMDFGLEDCF